MMMVITYDVETTSAAGQKRLRKVAKICERFGVRVQNSVFEVMVDSAQLAVLKSELERAICKETDSVRFYRLGKNFQSRVDTMGRSPKVEAGGELMF